MNYTKSEVLQYVSANDVRFIKLFYIDIFGNVKSISIQPGELDRAFSTGIPFDANAVKGFSSITEGDLYLVPDPATLSVLPWRPQQGRVVRFFCNIKWPDSSAFDGDTRQLLLNTLDKIKKLGFECRVGTKCEFYLFKLDENGKPTLTPQDYAGYCDLAPIDKGENVRREICLTLAKMGIEPEFSFHEAGPGQHQVVFRHALGLEAIDNLETFKTVVRTVANGCGLFATFLPKPLKDEAGSGLLINISLYKNGINCFDGEELSAEAKSFMAGIFAHIREITAFLNPLPSSYIRFGSHNAPNSLAWTRKHSGKLLRVPLSRIGEIGRVEVRSPDPSCNPYLALSLILEAGMEGLEKNLVLKQQEDAEEKQNEMLPSSIEEALNLVKQSNFVIKVLPPAMLESFTNAVHVEPLFGKI